MAWTGCKAPAGGTFTRDAEAMTTLGSGPRAAIPRLLGTSLVLCALSTGSAAQTITEIIDATGDGAGNTLNTPSGLAVDASGNVFVGGAGSDNGFKIAPGGAITEIIDATGDGAGNTLTETRRVGVDASGNFYITGVQTDNGFEIAPGGTITEIIDATGDGGGNTLNSATSIAGDSSDNAYVTGGSSDNAFKITQGGTITEIIDATGDGLGNALDIPQDVVVDSSGNVFVAGGQTGNVFKITPGGTITEIIDAAGDGSGNVLTAAYDVAVDSSGNVYVAGATSDNAFRIATPGSCSTGGTPCTITEIIDATGDGTGNALDGTVDVAVDSGGNVYVVGSQSDNGFKITTPGTCSTGGAPCAITEIIDATGDGAGNLLESPRGIAVDSSGNVYVSGGITDNVFKIAPPVPPVPFATSDLIDGSVVNPGRVFPVDMDNDADLDVLTLSDTSPRWYENTAGDGSSWTLHTIPTNAHDFIAAVDWNVDGKLDVVGTSVISPDGVLWYENLGGGTSWSAAQSVAAGIFAQLPTPADFDRDGLPDVAAHTADITLAFEIATLENDGGSATIDTLTGSNFVYSMEAGDIDGDGAPDLVVLLDGTLFWYENDETAAWPAGNTISTDPGAAPGLALADVDRDGALDVVLADTDQDEVSWFRNTGGGASWSLETDIQTGLSNPSSVSVADLDQDGTPDVVAGDDDQVVWLSNDAGDGSSWSPTSISAATDGADSLAFADLDGDGDLDVVYSERTDGVVGWYENQTIHRSAAFPDSKRSIVTAPGLPGKAFAADLNGDGDVDVLLATSDPKSVTWYENTDGMGTFGTQQVITSKGGPTFAADLDGDGDLDALSGGLNNDEIFWYENTDGAGTFGPEQIVTSDIDDPREVLAADVDGDGDLDVLSSSSTADTKIVWYENTDGAGTFGPQQVIAVPPCCIQHLVFAGDLDRDGDADALSVGANSGIRWYENTAGDGSAWSTNIITSLLGTGLAGYAADFDGDGDLDVISGSAHYTGGTPSWTGTIAWYENTNGAGAFGPQQLISTGGYPNLLFASDLDLDGDVDVLFSSFFDSEIAWYENTDGAGTFGPAQPILTAALIPQSLFVTDVDGDGDVDFLASSGDPPKLAWYENRGGQFALPTTDTAFAGLVDGGTEDLLAIAAAHRGRSGDSDLELVTLELRFEDEFGAALSSAQANALIASLEIHRDDGSGAFRDGVDTQVHSVASLNLSGGLETLTFTDADPNVQVAHGSPATFFVVVELQADASSQTPDRFQVLHMTESSSSAEDRDTDIALELEFATETGSGVVRALAAAGDEDSDGLNNFDENANYTDPFDSDSDDDSVSDGDEVNTHLSDPLDTDTDDDGLDDGAEVALTTLLTDPDHDNDGVCDGGGTGAGACTAGPDNCPFVGNLSQTNSDVFEAGDDCQCGDVTGGDGVITSADVDEVREHLMDVTPMVSPGPLDFCDVAGTPDCGVDDIFALERAANGLSATIQNSCAAYFGP